jgi:hypothetical protein
MILENNNNTMTKEKAIEMPKQEQQNFDTEAAHAKADNILCHFLTALGYQDVVAEYNQVNKWYA